MKPCERPECTRKAQYRIDVGLKTVYLCGLHVDEAQKTNPSRYV